MKKFLIIAAVSAFALTTLFTSCSDVLTSPSGANDTPAGKAVVSIGVRNPGVLPAQNVRTVFPTLNNTRFELWGAEATPPKAAETKLADFTGLSNATVTLTQGTWNFTLKVFNAEDESETPASILEGTETGVDIASSGIKQLNFYLVPQKDGTGSIELIVNLPKHSGVNKVLIYKDDSDITEAVLDSENATAGNAVLADGNDEYYTALTYTADNVAAGDYFYSIRLFYATEVGAEDTTPDVLLGSVSEMVQVRSGLLSTKTYDLLLEDLNLAPIKPAAPDGFYIDVYKWANDNSTLILAPRWNDNSNNETGFVLNVTKNSEASEVYNISANDVVINELNENEYYNEDAFTFLADDTVVFELKAVNGMGESDTITVEFNKLKLPGPVTNLTGRGTGNNITLSWNPVVGVDWYAIHIYNDPAATGFERTGDTWQETIWTDTEVLPTETPVYRVHAGIPHQNRIFDVSGIGPGATVTPSRDYKYIVYDEGSTTYTVDDEYGGFMVFSGGDIPVEAGDRLAVSAHISFFGKIESKQIYAQYGVNNAEIAEYPVLPDIWQVPLDSELDYVKYTDITTTGSLTMVKFNITSEELPIGTNVIVTDLRVVLIKANKIDTVYPLVYSANGTILFEFDDKYYQCYIPLSQNSAAFAAGETIIAELKGVTTDLTIFEQAFLQGNWDDWGWTNGYFNQETGITEMDFTLTSIVASPIGINELNGKFGFELLSEDTEPLKTITATAFNIRKAPKF
jgi:hypothetical protein